jgi:hypothetical protein
LAPRNNGDDVRNQSSTERDFTCFRDRVEMMHRDGWAGNKVKNPTASAWFVFDRDHRGPATMHRISYDNTGNGRAGPSKLSITSKGKIAMATKKPKANEENVVPLKIVKPGRLDKFKSKKKPSIGGLETAPTILGILKIGDTNDFVRLHPNEDEYWSDELCFVSVPIIGDKHDQLHLIDEEIAVRYLPAKKIKRFRLALATKPYDVFFLCQVPSVHLDNSWNNTALKACLQAKTHWVQVSSRKEENVEGYKCDKAKDADAFPEPKWLSPSLDDLIELSFHGAIIETDDHAGLRRVIGARQNLS